MHLEVERNVFVLFTSRIYFIVSNQIEFGKCPSIPTMGKVSLKSLPLEISMDGLLLGIFPNS